MTIIEYLEHLITNRIKICISIISPNNFSVTYYPEYINFIDNDNNYITIHTDRNEYTINITNTTISPDDEISGGYKISYTASDISIYINPIIKAPIWW